jgi:hypothetical protein
MKHHPVELENLTQVHNLDWGHWQPVDLPKFNKPLFATWLLKMKRPSDFISAPCCQEPEPIKPSAPVVCEGTVHEPHAQPAVKAAKSQVSGAYRGGKQQTAPIRGRGRSIAQAGNRGRGRAAVPRR